MCISSQWNEINPYNQRWRFLPAVGFDTRRLPCLTRLTILCHYFVNSDIKLFATKGSKSLPPDHTLLKYQSKPAMCSTYAPTHLASADWISSPALLGRLSPGRKSLIGCGTLATTFCTTGTRRKLNMIDCPNHTKPPPQIQNMHQILKTTHIKLEIVSLLHTQKG